MMDRKAKGARAEHKSIRIFESMGYHCTRSGASLGVFDVIAISSTDVILCQVKTRDWPGALETETLRLFEAPPNARKIIHRWRDRQSFPDVKEI
jgi:hypothetical protein